MIHPVTIKDFMALPEPVPLADVRTPAEFMQGHMPGASQLPIFSNEERMRVGTTYKQEGREAAIILGFDLIGARWSVFIRRALEIAPQKKIAVHCWRGGMRSGAMAWALDLYGFEVYLVEGGYKSYRRWVLQQFETACQLYIVGGMTGSGKTRILGQLRSMGEQVIDLEDLARHQGSAYGTLNKLVQPTQEQFENNLAHELKQLDLQRRIWVEDESITIGKRFIPKPFFSQMQAAALIDVRVPLEQRVQALVKEYGILDKDFLVECTERIRKRLGPEQTKNAIAAIREDDMAGFIRLVIAYYDKTYRTALAKRSAGPLFPLEVQNTDPVSNARQIVDLIRAMPVAGRI
jgi:tRNA 2-selenouridine synthase